MIPVDPVGYTEMLSLVSQAQAVLTDSGGLQKETVLLGTRCFTLRPETEWPETLEAGWNTVVDLDPAPILQTLAESLPTRQVTTLGDGHAADRIATLVMSHLA